MVIALPVPRREERPMSLLFAQGEPSIPWWTSILSAPVLVGLWEFLKWTLGEWRKGKSEDAKQTATREQAYITHLEGLVARQTQVIEAKDEAAVRRDTECDKTVQAVSDYRVLTERCLGHCRYLEALLEQNKVQYRHLDSPEAKP